MKDALKALLVFGVMVLGSGCAGTDRQAECHGPWVPVNTVERGHAHG